VTIEQAYADLLRVHKGMIATGSKVNEITFPKVMPLRDRYLRRFSPGGSRVAGRVGLVLLIACVNIAALMMVRRRCAGSARRWPFARPSGAGRAASFKQLLTEHAVLALLGGIGGVGLGALLRVHAGAAGQGIPHWVSFPMDARFALFFVAIPEPRRCFSSCAGGAGGGSRRARLLCRSGSTLLPFSGAAAVGWAD